MNPFSIDTRTIQPGDVFVALDGNNVKGHTFLEQAFARGASTALCAQAYRESVRSEWHSRIQFVQDPAAEMAHLAREYRKQVTIPIIGVVGSVGKTSTKQFLAYLLSRKFNVLATVGNLNNQLGLPMMLSRIKPEHNIAALEMGADHVGDLANLVHIAEPTAAVLTPIAPEHLLGFGSLAGVYDGELEILLSPHLETLVTVEGDTELDRRLKKWNGKVVRVGFSQEADVVLSDLRVENGKTIFKIQGQPVILPTAASFLALNAGLAAAMAVESGLSWSDISGEWNPELPKGRFAARKIARDITVIDDTYNSSPKAFSAALDAFKKINFKRKWIVFSDMLELGTESAHWHDILAEDISQSDVYAAWAFGAEAKRTIDRLAKQASGIKSRWFENADSLAEELVRCVEPGDAILFKGSRGMRVENVLEILEQRLSLKVS